MTTQRPNLNLINFVHHLYEMHSDNFGVIHGTHSARCQRWLDAVLPAEPRVVEFELPDDEVA
jgi:hypothetical protein